MSMKPNENQGPAERTATALDPSGNDGRPSFIRPWRLDDRPRGQTNELVSCSVCGCGISPELKS
jgi:hypothetical protein